MPTLIRVPRLYPEMEEATVGRWLLKPGDPAAPREPLVEIITDKVTYEVESPESGEAFTLLVTCAEEKSVLPVDSILAILGQPGEVNLPDWRSENQRLAHARRKSLGSPSVAPGSPAPVPSGQAASGGSPPAAAPHAGSAPGGVRATPAARRAARAAGIALEEVASIAAGATITESDVERYLASTNH